jgi:HD-GYP domain-containing protein (c-di-GMP phosphodiesterase class II)
VPEQELSSIRQGALLHDMGKMALPDSILRKPGPLDEVEWAQMKKHPELANQWLTSIPYLKKALDIPLCHHEKWDGTGYPHGLQGEAIPLAARIFMLVDVWDAMTSDRPYRPAQPENAAIQYIREQAGQHFDPWMAQQFLVYIHAMQKIGVSK